MLIVETALVLFLSFHVVPYFVDRYSLRRYPGPFLAKFSYLWKLWTFCSGRYSEILAETHKKYGPIVRISPCEISFSAPGAMSEIYSPRTNGVFKADFYDGFMSNGSRSIFSTVNRAQHAPIRKDMSHIFSGKIIADFTPRMKQFVNAMLDKWEHMPKEGFDCLPWCSYLAMDWITALLFDNPWGVVNAGEDTVAVPKDATHLDETINVPAISILSERAQIAITLAMVPSWWRPLVKLAMRKQMISSQHVINLTMRMIHRSGPNALFWNLKQDHVRPGAAMMGLMIAGSDTMTTSLATGLFHLALHPHVQDKLHKEFISGASRDYLHACVNEMLRVQPTVGLGLPRIVPPQGLTVYGQTLTPGTTIAAPYYTASRDASVWGPDAEDFRPERWLEDDENMNAKKREFQPFSEGPMACLGKALALAELRTAYEMIVLRYELKLLETGPAKGTFQSEVEEMQHFFGST
ncbi:cytochrome P450 [Hymenopellis radicata]|nr:cytochrome P450 [Hymenopellis radicata]